MNAALTAINALDFREIERLTLAPGEEQWVLPPDCARAGVRDEKENFLSRPAEGEETELLVAISGIAMRSSAAKESALMRLRQTGNPALLAAFWFSQGMLWRRRGAIASGADEARQAMRHAAASFQAATEVVQPDLHSRCMSSYADYMRTYL